MNKNKLDKREAVYNKKIAKLSIKIDNYCINLEESMSDLQELMDNFQEEDFEVTLTELENLPVPYDGKILEDEMKEIVGDLIDLTIDKINSKIKMETKCLK